MKRRGRFDIGPIRCLRTADEICEFVREDKRKITYLVRHEGLPAWQRNGQGVWYALDIHLEAWLLRQANKYLPESLKNADQIESSEND